MTIAPVVIRNRSITGMSAVLLPFHDDTTIDWFGFEAHLDRTIAAGIIPALNMDTGFGPVLSAKDRDRVLAIGRDRAVAFIAGAHVPDSPTMAFDLASYCAEFERIESNGGTPIVFPSFGMASLTDDKLVSAHQNLARTTDSFYGFELGAMFHPAGRIFSLEVFTALLDLPQIVGLKHSSLSREQEWLRLEIRDRLRPGFRVLTGNDLAIDMVTYGSDYLLGLSTFAPDAFAARDRAWEKGDDPTFFALNDQLQYLGHIAFRTPVPGYRHNAAMFLKLRNWIASDTTHRSSPQRPDSDRAILAPIATAIAALVP